MSAIKQALSRLNSAVGNLEQSIGNIETTMADNQRTVKMLQDAQTDMFDSPSNENSFDPQAVAEKLDSAIQKVERVLQESQG